MKQVVFITGNLNQPRVIKRIESFYDRGYQIKVYGFDRGTFQNVNVLNESIKVVKWGDIENGKNYLSSFKFNKEKILPVIKEYKENSGVVFYVFGFIPALIFYLYSNSKYIYEISDLIYGYFKSSFVRKIFKIIDKRIISKSELTVLTSQGFYQYFYNSNIKENVLVQPNKVSESLRNIDSNDDLIKNDSIRFSFIGFLRYPKTVFGFAEIIGEMYQNYSFHFYGDSEYREQAAELSEKYKNVFFHGKFKNPDDLQIIYNNVDVIVACYDTSTFNERVAEPNKLYESIFFNKPIIVSDDTFLAQKVEDLGCGYCIDASTKENILKFINSIDIENINMKKTIIKQIPKESVIDRPEDIIDFLENRTWV